MFWLNCCKKPWVMTIYVNLFCFTSIKPCISVLTIKTQLYIYLYKLAFGSEKACKRWHLSDLRACLWVCIDKQLRGRYEIGNRNMINVLTTFSFRPWEVQNVEKKMRKLKRKLSRKERKSSTYHKKIRFSCRYLNFKLDRHP